VLPRWWKALWYLERISPTASARVWDAVLAKLRRDFDALGVRAIPRDERG
jgi:hypothetical protein